MRGLLPKTCPHGLLPALHRTHAVGRRTCGPDPRRVRNWPRQPGPAASGEQLQRKVRRNVGAQRERQRVRNLQNLGAARSPGQ
eukprot:15472791-Alexandrium_andersonii.AAC.1